MLPSSLHFGSGDRDRIAALNKAEGPRDLWSPAEDRVAAAGISSRMRVCKGAGDGDRFLKL